MPLHSQWIFFLIATWKQVKFWQYLRWKFGITPLFIFKSTFLSAATKGSHPLCKQDSSRASELPAEPAERDTHQRVPSTQGLQGTAYTSCACPALLPRLNVHYSSWFFHRQRHGGATGWIPAVSASHWLCCSGTSHHRQRYFSLSLRCLHRYACPLTLSPLISNPFPSGGARLPTTWPRLRVHSARIVPGVQAGALGHHWCTSSRERAGTINVASGTNLSPNLQKSSLV